jgi:hypothetical protein
MKIGKSKNAKTFIKASSKVSFVKHVNKIITTGAIEPKTLN